MWVNGDNAARIIKSLDDFGFSGLGISESDCDHLDWVAQLGYPPHRIDILTSIDGVDFDGAWSRRLTIEIDGAPVPSIGKDDLITNKRVVGRPQDIADVARLTNPNL